MQHDTINRNAVWNLRSQYQHQFIWEQP